MARTRAETSQPEPANETDELSFEEVEWVAGKAPDLHPQLVERLEHSWANRVVKGNLITTPAFKITAPNVETLKKRERQLRDAGAHLGVGVAIKAKERIDGSFDIHFRARKRRGSGPA